MRNEERLRNAHIEEMSGLINKNIEREISNPIETSTPIQIVDLPSKGLFYPANHPWYRKESIEIRYMTAKDEDILVNKSYIQKGVILEKLIANILIDRNVNLETVLSCDKIAIIVAARITGYGSEYYTDVVCPICSKNNSKYLFNLELFTNEFPDEEKLRSAQVSLTEHGTFLLELPRSKATVELKLLNGADEKRLENSIERKRKQNLPDSLLTDNLKSFIVTVNDRDETSYINDFIDSMPAFDAKFLRRMYSFIVPSVKNKQEFICIHCLENQEVEVPLTKTFFWSD